MFKNKFNPLKSGMIAAIFALISFLILSYPENVFASTNIDMISVTESCYPAAGGTITINYRFHNRQSYSYPMYDAVLITDSADSTPNWNDPSVWNSTGAPNPPTIIGFTGYSQGSVAGSAYISISHVVNIPAVWTGTKRILILQGDDSSKINFPDQYTQQYMEADTSYTINECAANPITAQKSASPMSVCVGNNVTFCITATNTGSSVRTFNVWDTVPTGLTYVGCDNSCSWDGTNKVVSWTITDLAASGGAATTCFWASVNAVP